MKPGESFNTKIEAQQKTAPLFSWFDDAVLRRFCLTSQLILCF
jgi:hypothetical protein